MSFSYRSLFNSPWCHPPHSVHVYGTLKVPFFYFNYFLVTGSPLFSWYYSDLLVSFLWAVLGVDVLISSLFRPPNMAPQPLWGFFLVVGFPPPYFVSHRLTHVGTFRYMSLFLVFWGCLRFRPTSFFPWEYMFPWVTGLPPHRATPTWFRSLNFPFYRLDYCPIFDVFLVIYLASSSPLVLVESSFSLKVFEFLRFLHGIMNPFSRSQDLGSFFDSLLVFWIQYLIIQLFSAARFLPAFRWFS